MEKKRRMDVVAARHKFLQDIRKYRSLRYTISYQDETWCNAHHAQQYIWIVVKKFGTLTNCLQCINVDFTFHQVKAHVSLFVHKEERRDLWKKPIYVL